MIVPRRPKELGNLNFADEVNEGKLDIIDVELDEDFNAVFDNVNGNLDNDNISSTGPKIIYEKLNLVGKIKGTDLASGFTIPGSAIPAGSVTNVMLAPGASFWDFGQAPPRFGDAINISALGGAPATNYLSITGMKARATPMNFIFMRLYVSGTGSATGIGTNITARVKRDNVGFLDVTGFCPNAQGTNIDIPWTIAYDGAIALADANEHTYAVDILQLTAGLATVRAGTFVMLAPS